MSPKADYFLKKTLGEDFMESLAKVELWKPGTRSTVDHEELRTALQIVPRTVMALLIRELTPMAIGETKEVVLFVAGNAKMRVTKHERDVYSGDIEQENKKVVDFKFRALPGVGLVIMSAFELYDMENLINSPNPVDMHDGAEQKVQHIIEERMNMHDLVHKVVDKKMLEREAVDKLLMQRLTQELHATKEDLERERIRLAGAGVAALGYVKPGEFKPGDYAHSAAMDDVIRVRQEADEAKKKLDQIAQLPKINQDSTPQEDPYFRGMTNGAIVAAAVATGEHDPKFVEVPRKTRPLKEFLESRKKTPIEFSVKLAKGESVCCPDCKKNIFDGQVFSGCICLGDDMERKLFIKREQDGIKVRFGKGWDEENIEMLLEVLRRKRG